MTIHTKKQGLHDRLCQIDNGRFKDLMRALRISETCAICDFFNLSLNDPDKRYYCHVVGSCIDATLSFELRSYLNLQLEWITMEQHHDNLHIIAL